MRGCRGGGRARRRGKQVARHGAREGRGGMTVAGRRGGIGGEVIFHLLHVAIKVRTGVASGRGGELQVTGQTPAAGAAVVVGAAFQRRREGATGNKRAPQVGADHRLRPGAQPGVAHAFGGGVAQFDGVDKNAVQRREHQCRAHGGEHDFDERESVGGARPAGNHGVVDPVVVASPLLPAVLAEGLTSVVRRTLRSLPCTG